MSRRAVALAAAAVAVFFAVTLVTLTHVISSGEGCAIAVPQPNLPASLRALGGFDQSFDAGNLVELARVGQNAAAVVTPDLDGAMPLQPVIVSAVTADRPAAVVIPLAARESTGTGARVVGLVSFYVGCSGRAYFGAAVDVSALGSGAAATFPAVGEAVAAAQLGISTPQLVYTTSPFTPEWRNPQSGATIPAGE